VRLKGIIGRLEMVAVLSAPMGEWSGRKLELQDLPPGGTPDHDIA
jgi:hypothetical protein